MSKFDYKAKEIKMCINCKNSRCYKDVKRVMYFCNLHRVAIPYNFFCNDYINEAATPSLSPKPLSQPYRVSRIGDLD
jgi:hypothetical protein